MSFSTKYLFAKTVRIHSMFLVELQSNLPFCEMVILYKSCITRFTPAFSLLLTNPLPLEALSF